MKFNGKAFINYRKTDDNPKAIKMDFNIGKGSIKISTQYSERGANGTRTESFEKIITNGKNKESAGTENCIIDLKDCADGDYVVDIVCENAKNISFKCVIV